MLLGWRDVGREPRARKGCNDGVQAWWEKDGNWIVALGKLPEVRSRLAGFGLAPSRFRF